MISSPPTGPGRRSCEIAYVADRVARLRETARLWAAAAILGLATAGTLGLTVIIATKARENVYVAVSNQQSAVSQEERR